MKHLLTTFIMIGGFVCLCALILACILAYEKIKTFIINRPKLAKKLDKIAMRALICIYGLGALLSILFIYVEIYSKL